MHLAQFVHRYPPALGGAEAYAKRLTGHLQRRGDRVTMWTSTAVHLEEFWNGSARQDQILDNIRRYRPIRFPLRRWLLKMLTLIPNARLQAWALPCNPIMPGMWRDARRYNGPLDAVHATAFPYAWPILCARRLARRRGVPFLLTPFLHLGDQRTVRQYTQPALRWLLHDADRIFVQTKLEKMAVLRLGVPPERVVLQGLGVALDECTGGDGPAFRERLGIQPNEFVIGHLANLSREKGSLDLIEACRRLHNEGARFRLVLAGPSMANFREFVRRLPPLPWVTILEPPSDAERNNFYAAIDAFALPSRCDSFGLVLLEAWANGVPCVAYHAGGPGEIIRHEKDGLLATCGDDAELARHLRRLIDDPTQARTMGAAGSARTLDEFAWEPRLEIFRRTVLDCINRGQRGGPPGARWNPSRQGFRKSAALHRCG